MRKRTSDYYSSDTEQMAASEAGAGGGMMMVMEEDIFLLRPPQRTDQTGAFQEAKRAYDSGTDEVRQLLLHECSLIYECRACRNMFRSLAQFMSHKRLYCCNTVDGGESSNGHSGDGNFNGFTDHNLIAQKSSGHANTTLPSVPKNDSVDSGLKSMNTSESSLKDDVVNCARSVPSTLPLDGSADTMGNVKTEWAQNAAHNVNEQVEKNAPAAVGQSGEASKQQQEQDSNGFAQANGHIFCDICKGVFQTEKMLKQHIQKKHMTSYVFRCPSCTMTFMQPAEVIRHLAIEHKKSVHRIRMMRESILKRRIQSGEEDEQEKQKEEQLQLKIAPNRELKRLQSSPDVVGSMGAGGIGSDGSAPKKIMSPCLYCGKSFERRAALSTHLLHCRVKHSSLEKSSLLMGNGGAVLNKRLKLQPNDESFPISGGNTEAVKSEKTVTDADPDTELLNEMFANLGKQTFGGGLRTISLDEVDLSEKLEEEEKSTNVKNEVDSEETVLDIKPAIVKEPTAIATVIQVAVATEIEEEVKDETSTTAADGKKPRRRFRIVHAEKRLSCRCKICNKQFNALSNLRRHISMFHYRAQRFGCTLCEYRAFRRYDIVNHLGYVHKMQGEREAMSTEFVSVHEVNYSKDDVDSDIVLLPDEQDALAATSVTSVGQLTNAKAYEKRARRRKLISGTSGEESGAAGKITRQKLKRSHLQPEGGNGKALQKRPIRNRIKPVNKDFVYDLSNLLKKEVGALGANELVRTLKRRNTMCSDNMNAGVVHDEPLLAPSRLEHIRGAAQRLTLSLVSQGLAASATQPELPTERPQMRPRLISTNRADMQPVPVIEASELEAARLKSTLLDDTFLEKVSKRSTPVFKIKPCLALQHSTLSWLLEKVDSSMHNNARPSEALSNGIDCNTVSPLPSIPKASSPPATPRKRITLLERLSENKARYRESLLRSALEN